MNPFLKEKVKMENWDEFKEYFGLSKNSGSFGDTGYSYVAGYYDGLEARDPPASDIGSKWGGSQKEYNLGFKDAQGDKCSK